MEHKPNEKLSFNEQKLLKNMLNLVILLFNMNPFKYVLFDNFNVLVLLKKIHKHTCNVMEQHF